MRTGNSNWFYFLNQYTLSTYKEYVNSFIFSGNSNVSRLAGISNFRGHSLWAALRREIYKQISEIKNS